jgi:hypothetical protein
MSIANIINVPKLLDEIFGFDSSAELFVNNVDENKENPTFINPSFVGYGPISLSKDKWGPAVNGGNYATIEYQEPIIWNNTIEGTDSIKGYYIKNSSNKLLWFKTFDTPFSMSVGESVSIYPKVFLNRYDSLTTTFTFNIINSNPNSYTLIDPKVEITEEMWGLESATGSLFDVSLSGFKPIKGVISAGVAQRINPTAGNPFSFTIKTVQSGFINFSKNVSITEPGDYAVTIKLIEYSGYSG